MYFRPWSVMLACVALLVLVTGTAVAQKPGFGQGGDRDDDRASGPFASGEKLPGDLSDLLDADKDGKISDREAVAAVAGLMAEANARKPTDRGKMILDALDKNKDGKLDAVESQDAVAKARIEADDASRAVGGVLSRLDGDANGLITTQEFAGLTEQLGPFGQYLRSKLGQMFTEMDGNRDGAITVGESQMVAESISRQTGIGRFGGNGFGRGGRFGGFGGRPGDNNDNNGNNGNNGGSNGGDSAMQRSAQDLVTRLDTNRDGRVSRREAASDKQVQNLFAVLDGNLDDHLTVEEIYAYLESQKE